MLTLKKTPPVTIREIQGTAAAIEFKVQSRDFRPNRVQIVRPDNSNPITIPCSQIDAGKYRFPLPPMSPNNTTAFRLRLIDTEGAHRWTRIADAPDVDLLTDAGIIVIRGAASQPYFYSAHANLIITGIRLADGELALDAIGPLSASETVVELVGRRATLSTTVSSKQRLHPYSLNFSLQNDAGDEFEKTIVPNGTYSVVASHREEYGPLPLRVQMSPDLECRYAPTVIEANGVQVSIRSRTARRPVLDIRSGLSLAEQTPGAQRSLQLAYANNDADLEPLVYLQCLRGDQVADSQLALARRLSALYPSVSVVWGIQDRSIRVPRQNGSVIVGSAQYYDILAKAAVICVNHEVPNYINSRPGQLVVQTYHGHPFKMMGLGRWSALRSTQIQIERGLAWRQKWDLLVSPTPLATRLYREHFPVRAEILEIGHPRNDQLANSSTVDICDARRRLGLVDSDTAVLYAPTWRDYAASNPWKSEMVQFMDPEEFASGLGTNFKVLLRGHPAHGRSDYSAIHSKQVIDVTYHPDVNELMLAADIGIFDYSSIRFDFAVTGKPMIFFVPDREKFFEAAPSLIPYDETTPGPQVSSLDELILAVKNIQSLREFDTQYSLFRTTFAGLDDGHAADRLVDALVDRSAVLAKFLHESAS
jgi:CDP-glycerol glycerophosphotransferase (TagB/SpsB family)